jgi:hypothetical protein
MKKWYALLIGMILSPCCLIGAAIAFVVYLDYQQDLGYEIYLSYPLPTEIVSDFCARQMIPPDMADCNAASIVIAQRHVPDIFRFNLSERATYGDVTQHFGNYEYNCQRDPQNTISYSCQYRFGGYDIILIYDTETNVIVEMISESSGS